MMGVLTETYLVLSLAISNIAGCEKTVQCNYVSGWLGKDSTVLGSVCDHHLREQ